MMIMDWVAFWITLSLVFGVFSLFVAVSAFEDYGSFVWGVIFLFTSALLLSVGFGLVFGG